MRNPNPHEEPFPWRSAPRTRARVLAGVVLALAGYGLLRASHNFNDVPPGTFFHDVISRLVGAGITVGTSPTTFTPDGNVTRGEFAAFMGRGAGRVAHSSTLVNTVTQGITTVAELRIMVPGAATTATQFVAVYGEVTVIGGGSVVVRLRNETDDDDTPVASYVLPAAAAALPHGVQRAWVWAVTPGAKTFQLQVGNAPGGPSLGLENPSLIAMTFPFGATGGNTLGPAPE